MNNSVIEFDRNLLIETYHFQFLVSFLSLLSLSPSLSITIYFSFSLSIYLSLGASKEWLTFIIRHSYQRRKEKSRITHRSRKSQNDVYRNFFDVVIHAQEKWLVKTQTLATWLGDSERANDFAVTLPTWTHLTPKRTVASTRESCDYLKKRQCSSFHVTNDLTNNRFNQYYSVEIEILIIRYLYCIFWPKKKLGPMFADIQMSFYVSYKINSIEKLMSHTFPYGGIIFTVTIA